MIKGLLHINKGGLIMGTLLILGVCVAFLAAIFTAGYETKVK